MGIKQRSKSLLSQKSELADPQFQLQVINGQDSKKDFTKFEDNLAQSGHYPLTVSKLEIFQINLGKMCNQSCAHCHVDAGPDRKEIMTRENLEICLDILRKHPQIHTVDLTGGAPEMNPHFSWFVESCAEMGKKIMVRSNLTIIVSNPKYHYLPEFFAKHRVEVISSLPFYSAKRTDKQRGEGVFEDSIRAIELLNNQGYGQKDSGLMLHLVYNPSGAFLPGNQLSLEAEFKRQLARRHDIVFNNLLAITNLPINRFLDYLVANDNYEFYMEQLLDAYNPATIDGLMCRNTISVSWDGFLYDCDFNQMLDLKTACTSQHIRDFDVRSLEERAVVLGQHCYGCTAGAGSSCGGTIT
ncbi:MAG TPA: radical SAM/Cys-rich domain protein [Saprospiraceae bacterium]|nr:radical SAM/Cys-rich domain protein [Saprospiraceae bacterium]